MPIFDQGYQHWEGQISGHTWRWLAITRQGVRAQMQKRLTRFVVLMALLPAIALGVVMSVWGLIEQKSSIVAPLLAFIELPGEMSANPADYRVAVWTMAYHVFFQVELRWAMILVLLVGPNLISQDLRFNAMPLYLSRPLTRRDYFLGKLGVIAVCLGYVVVLPPLIAYLLGVLFSMDFGVIQDTFHLLIGSLVFGSVVALSTGTLMLGLSSLSRSSRYVAIFWVGIWFVSFVLSAALTGLHREALQQNLWQLQSEKYSATYGGPSGWQLDQLNDEARQQAEQRQQESLRRQAELDERIAAAQREYLELIREDWRPLISYLSNLSRLEAALLDTDSAYDRFWGRGTASPDAFEVIQDAEMKGPQHPWYWSAGVLLALMGISVWILHIRVRSLDRLR